MPLCLRTVPSLLILSIAASAAKPHGELMHCDAASKLIQIFVVR